MKDRTWSKKSNKNWFFKKSLVNIIYLPYPMIENYNYSLILSIIFRETRISRSKYQIQ